MKHLIYFAFLILSSAGLSLIMGLRTITNWPETEITNGQLRAKIYLPDHQKGYYRGLRFDWAGVISRLEFKGHQYFGQWYPKHDPLSHDAIMGPVDEFVPLSFDETAIGQEFIKIGVGSLIRTDDKPYAFTKMYKVKDPGKWSYDVNGNQVSFRHFLKGANGFSYEYVKTVKLEPGLPRMVLEHTLKNTGTKLIETQTYNHNFFVIDQEPTGTSIVTTFPMEIAAEGKNFGELISPQTHQLLYKRQLVKGENVFSGNVTAKDGSKLPYNIQIENTKSGAGVKIFSETRLEKLVFWACNTTSCPEPYIQISVKPGEQFSWNIAYDFYTNK